MNCPYYQYSYSCPYQYEQLKNNNPYRPSPLIHTHFTPQLPFPIPPGIGPKYQPEPPGNPPPSNQPGWPYHSFISKNLFQINSCIKSFVFVEAGSEFSPTFTGWIWVTAVDYVKVSPNITKVYVYGYQWNDNKKLWTPRRFDFNNSQVVKYFCVSQVHAQHPPLPSRWPYPMQHIYNNPEAKYQPKPPSGPPHTPDMNSGYEVNLFKINRCVRNFVYMQSGGEFDFPAFQGWIWVTAVDFVKINPNITNVAVFGYYWNYITQKWAPKRFDFNSSQVIRFKCISLLPPHEPSGQMLMPQHSPFGRDN